MTEETMTGTVTIMFTCSCGSPVSLTLEATDTALATVTIQHGEGEARHTWQKTELDPGEMLCHLSYGDQLSDQFPPPQYLTPSDRLCDWLRAVHRYQRQEDWSHLPAHFPLRYDLLRRATE